MSAHARPKIEARGLTKRFHSNNASVLVAEDLSLTVRAGEFVAIVGPSGCGKSTLLNMLTGFASPDSGVVLVDGVLLSKPNARGILISQHGSVFPWLTVRENLMFGLNGHARAEKIQIADQYAGIVGLKGFENSFPHELSGGMLKRAELARALVVKPDILYMDEPFSALDALMKVRMRNELLRILAKEHHTVLLVTHDVEEAIHVADRILVLSQRPTRVQATFDVGLTHPRRLSSASVQQLRVEILRELGVGHDLLSSVSVDL